MATADIDVPIIDLSRGATPEGRKEVVAEIANACERCGFFMIRHHGVPQDVIDAFWSKARAFFDEPISVKEAIPMSPDYPYGYAGMNTEKAGNDKSEDLKGKGYDTSDLKESYQVCLSSETNTPPELPTPLWPAAPEGFKEVTTAYYRAMEKLSDELLSLIAEGLNLPSDFFRPTLQGHWGSLRVLNYPDLEAPPNPGQLRIAPHSDYGAITILRADDTPGGLQLLMAGNEWRDVKIPGDCFTINLGDLMQRWTNDKYKSTLHRVVCPPIDATVSCRRQSAAYFCNINRGTTVRTIATCITAEQPERYEPINAFAHLMERHARAMGAKAAYKPEEAKPATAQEASTTA
jgi:isopenicillin N synthase-like dioxygenase